MAGKLYFYTAIILFGAALVYTAFTLSKFTGIKDNSNEFYDAVKLISFANGGLILMMTLISFHYIKSDITAGPSYLFLMLHFNLFLSLMAVSVAVLSKSQ